MTHLITLISIIVFVGAFAGLTNFLRYYYKNLISNNYEVIKYLMSGIGAAALVPLLLNMLSSNLIQEQADFNNINYFVFAGFCFIAGYFSDRFISTVGEKILQDLEKTNNKVDKALTAVKENEEKIDFMVSAETEIEMNDTEVNFTPKDLILDDNGDDLSTHIKKIVQSFLGVYRFRTVEGIAKELGYNGKLVESVLKGLQSSGLAKKLHRNDGSEIWGLTQVGIEFAKRYE